MAKENSGLGAPTTKAVPEDAFSVVTPEVQEPQKKVSSRDSQAAMVAAKLPAEESAELARTEYDVIEATGDSERKRSLEEADSEKVRSEVIAAQLADFDPNSPDAGEQVAAMQFTYSMPIAGDALSFAIPNVLANLPKTDSFNRLDGFNDGATWPRQEYVTRLMDSEIDYLEQEQLRVIKAATNAAKEGMSVLDVFNAIGTEADKADDVLDVGFVRDLVYMAIPFIAQANLEKTMEEWTGSNVPLTEAAFMGEVTNQIKQELLNTSPGYREERARELIALLKKNSGIYGLVEQYVPESMKPFVQEITQSDTEAYLNMLAVNDTDFLENDDDWARWIDNSFTAIDAITLGYSKKIRDAAGAIKGLARGERATAARAMAVTDDAPKVEEILAIAAEDTTGRTSRAIGMSEEDHAGALLPNILGDAGYDLLPDYTKKVIDRNEALAQDIYGRRTRRDFFNNDEDQLVRDAVDRFNMDTGGQLQPTRSQIGALSETDDSFQYIAQFGATDSRGFRTTDAADEFAKQYLGSNAKYEVLAHDPASGKYYQLGEAPTGVEYVVRYDTTLRFGDEAAGTLDPLQGGLFGLKSNWVVNPSSKMDSQIRFAGTRAVDSASFVEQRLSDILRPFNKLKRSSQKRVIEVENAGAAAGKDYTPEDLLAIRLDGKPLSAKEIGGYYSRLQTRRALWQIENETLRKKFVSKNMRQVEADGFRHVGNVVSPEVLKNKTWAYNPHAKDVKSYAKSDLEDLYHAGGSVVKLWKPVVVDGHQVTHVLVDGVNSRISELPANVLRYVPGYQPRYYDARWFVRRKMNLKVDGEDVETVVPVAASNSYEAAQRMVSKQSNPEEFVIDMDRIRDSGLADSEALNWELDNMMFYNSRSDQEIASLGGDIIVDPVDALRRSVTTVANTLGPGRLREVLVEKFKNTYGDLLKKDGQGRPIFPERKSDILRPGPGSDQGKLYADAKAMHDYIRVINNGMSPSQKAYRAIVTDLAAQMERKQTRTSNIIASALYGAADDFSPIKVARTAAFTTQILAAPLRQAWIQSHQVFFLTGIDPTLTARSFFGDGFYLDSAFAMERAGVHQKGWAKAIANAVKSTIGTPMNTQEMENLYKNFSASGMPYLRANLQIENVSDRVLRVVGEAGYAAGERHNLSATYAFAYRKHLKDTGKKWQNLSDKDWETIAFKAREYSLNMTRADALNYQHGIFSAATQYLAIRHKAINAVLTSKEFTSAERRRIIAGQLLMFGLEGTGIGMVVNKMIESAGITYEDTDVPGIGRVSAATIKQSIEGGIYDLMANKTLQALVEQDMETDVQFSRSMAALGEADRFVATMLTSLPSIDGLELAMGPSASVLGNSNRVVRELYALTHTELDTEDKIAVGVESLISLFSVGSNQLKGIVGERLKVMVDSKGRPISMTTDAESLIKKYWGFGTSQEHEYYEALKSEMGSGSFKSDYINEAADILATMIRRDTLRGNYERARGISAAVYTLWPNKYERGAIREAMTEKLSTIEIGNEALYSKLVQEWDVKTSQEIRTKLMNDSYMLRNPQARENLRSMIEEEETNGGN